MHKYSYVALDRYSFSWYCLGGTNHSIYFGVYFFRELCQGGVAKYITRLIVALYAGHMIQEAIKQISQYVWLA